MNRAKRLFMTLALAVSILTGNITAPVSEASAAENTEKKQDVYFSGYRFSFPHNSWLYMPGLSSQNNSKTAIYIASDSEIHIKYDSSDPDSTEDSSKLSALMFMKTDSTKDTIADTLKGMTGADPQLTEVRGILDDDVPSYRVDMDMDDTYCGTGITFFPKDNEAITALILCSKDRRADYSDFIDDLWRDGSFGKAKKVLVGTYYESWFKKQISKKEDILLWAGKYPRVEIKVKSCKKQDLFYKVTSTKGNVFYITKKYKKNSKAKLYIYSLKKTSKNKYEAYAK